MKYLLFIPLFLASCQTIDKLPDPEPSPEGGIIGKVGEKIDKTDSRVGAAILVAKENVTDKPTVAIKELDVASSYLPKPTEGDVAFARQRALANDDKAYLEAIAYGKKTLADLDRMWLKMESDQKKSQAEIDALKKEILRLNDVVKAKDVEIVKAKQDMVTMGCVAIGGIAALGAIVLAWGKQFTAAGASGAVATIALAYPSLMDTPWFLPSLGGLLVVGLGLWFAFLRRPNTETVP